MENDVRRDKLRHMMETDVVFPDVENITAKEAAALEDVLFVDVRDVKEFQVSAIPGAVHYRKFEEMMKAGTVTQKNICCYCTIGVRSGKYGTRLKRSPFMTDKRVLNLNGSILDWTHEPTCAPLRKPDAKNETANGEPADQVHVFGESWDLASTRYEPVKFSKLERALEGARWAMY